MLYTPPPTPEPHHPSVMSPHPTDVGQPDYTQQLLSENTSLRKENTELHHKLATLAKNTIKKTQTTITGSEKESPLAGNGILQPRTQPENIPPNEQRTSYALCDISSLDGSLRENSEPQSAIAGEVMKRVMRVCMDLAARSNEMQRINTLVQSKVQESKSIISKLEEDLEMEQADMEIMKVRLSMVEALAVQYVPETEKSQLDGIIDVLKREYSQRRRGDVDDKARIE